MLQNTASEIGAREVVGDTKIAKVSIVGVGMRSHAGVASRMFEALAKESINIQMISTSEIKVSVVIEEKYLELAVRALHTAFELDAPPVRASKSWAEGRGLTAPFVIGCARDELFFFSRWSILRHEGCGRSGSWPCRLSLQTVVP